MATHELPELLPQQEVADPRTKSRQEYYTRLNDWCDSAFEEALSLQEDVPELREMQSALDYLIGVQWKEAMPSYRAKPVSNEFASMFWETVGLLTDIRPMFNITDIGNDGKYNEVQRILNDTAKGWAATSRFEKTMSFCIMRGLLTSAPAKIWWDPFAKGTSGDPEDWDISFKSMAAGSLMRLGEGGDDIQQDECLIERSVHTLDWIKRAYPTMGKYVQAEKLVSQYSVDVQGPVGVMPQLFPPMSPGMKSLMGVGDKRTLDSVYKKAEVQGFWKNDDSINETRMPVWVGPNGTDGKPVSWAYQVAPGKKMYPRGRVFARANGVILYDQPSPYFHRRKPFAMLGLQGVPWKDYAMSVVGPWMKQQDILNQMMAGILQMVKKAINPALMAAKSAINPAAMKAIDASKPGLKITYSQNAPHAPQWQTPPVLPPYVLQSYSMVLNSMKQSSGAAAVGDAMSKKQVPGSDSLEKISFAKNTPIRFMGRNIEMFLDDVGAQWCANALQFYDAAKRMEMLGPAGLAKEDLDDKPGTLIPQGINSEAFVRRYHFRVEKGSLLQAQKAEKMQIAFNLRKLHDLSREQLFKILDWNVSQEENTAQLAKEAASMPQPAPKGKK